MGRPTWEKFTAGTSIGGAVINEIVEDGRLQSEVVYDVTWPCCGREGLQTHSQLTKRHRTEREKCWHCARKEAAATQKLTPCKPPKGDDRVPDYIIEIPLPGISGKWAHFGKLGSRFGFRGADFKSGRGA